MCWQPCILRCSILWYWNLACDWKNFWNFRSKGPRWSEIADFEPIFARSTLAVTPSEQSSIYTNRKSTMRFPMSPRWTSYIVPKPPKGLKNAVSKICTISCDNSETVWNRMSVTINHQFTDSLMGSHIWTFDWYVIAANCNCCVICKIYTILECKSVTEC